MVPVTLPLFVTWTITLLVPAGEVAVATAAGGNVMVPCGETDVEVPFTT